MWKMIMNPSAYQAVSAVEKEWQDLAVYLHSIDAEPDETLSFSNFFQGITQSQFQDFLDKGLITVGVDWTHGKDHTAERWITGGENHVENK